MSYEYGHRRKTRKSDRARCLFGPQDAADITKSLDACVGTSNLMQKQCSRLPGSREGTFIVKGLAQVAFAKANGPLTDWNKEEGVLRRYLGWPSDVCSLDVIEYHPCTTECNISTRMAEDSNKWRKAKTKPLTHKHSLPLFWPGVDLSEVEVLMEDTRRQCRSISATQVPCFFLCEPLCMLLKHGRWK